jgi:membrane-associated phospholipid phosphatase
LKNAINNHHLFLGNAMPVRPISVVTAIAVAIALLFFSFAQAATPSEAAGILQQFHLATFAGRLIPWSGITYLGDSTMTTPCAAILALWLALNGKNRAAARWALLFCAGMGLVVLTKLAFMGWRMTLPGLNFTGVSGHSASVIAVLPVLVYLLSAGLSLPLRIVLIGATFILIALVGVSRVVLHMHSESEVVIGLMLGACVSLHFIAYSGLGGQVMGGRSIVVLSLLLLAAISAGRPAPTQDWLEHIAVRLSGNAQPYVRGEPL